MILSQYPNYGTIGLNESPSEKEGKSANEEAPAPVKSCLNESPSEKEGKSPPLMLRADGVGASMKVPPKRKGN